LYLAAVHAFFFVVYFIYTKRAGKIIYLIDLFILIYLINESKEFLFKKTTKNYALDMIRFKSISGSQTVSINLFGVFFYVKNEIPNTRRIKKYKKNSNYLFKL
jgi:hypothetical protein